MLKSLIQMQRFLRLSLLLVLLLPAGAWAQSEITFRVTTAEVGYRGPVRHVQTQQTCDSTALRCFRVCEESFNAHGLRTAIVTIDSIGRFYTSCDFAPDGRLICAINGFPMGVDSLAFRYDKHGCPVAYQVTRFTSEGIDKEMSNLFRFECDDQCRPLLFITSWGDTSEYRYDSLGRLVYRALPGTEDTYTYDAHGRLVRVRTGHTRYIDQFFRYNERGDLIETWHTDWEQDAGGPKSPLPHIHYSYSQYDSHGNWTKAQMKVTESGRSYTCSVNRQISYYD